MPYALRRSYRSFVRGVRDGTCGMSAGRGDARGRRFGFGFGCVRFRGRKDTHPLGCCPAGFALGAQRTGAENAVALQIKPRADEGENRNAEHKGSPRERKVLASHNVE